MPELRKDPIIGRWVIIATERAMRPIDFITLQRESRGGFCPFCYGNENKTPPEIFAFRKAGTKPNTEGWWLRVVPNKFPALKVEGDLDRRGQGMYDLMNGIGAHEVIIETPQHDGRLGYYENRQIEEILWMYRHRVVELAKDRRFRYILLFKNKGAEAGASLDHPHSQLIAIPTVPKRVKEEIDGGRAYFEFKERCVYCDMIKQEVSDGRRVIFENRGFLAFEPFASRFPFETWILPKRHESHFESIDKREIVELAQVLKGTVRKIQDCLSDPPYNYVLHTAPVNEGFMEHYHWHIEIIPKLTKVAGFEWGSGFYINPTSPEDAAEYLRKPREEDVEAMSLHQQATMI